MANWCNNIVQFTADPEKLESIEQLFKAMSFMEQQLQHGQLPPFIRSDSGYLFNIYTEGGTIYYDTKWVPNTDILVQLADQFGVGFVHDYSELAMGIFGQATYQQGILTDISLDQEDFTRFEYDHDQEMYTYEGSSFESEIEIMELLLERKKDPPEQSQGYKR